MNGGHETAYILKRRPCTAIVLAAPALPLLYPAPQQARCTPAQVSLCTMRAAAGRAAASVAQQLRLHAAEAVPLAARWVYAFTQEGRLRRLGPPRSREPLPAHRPHAQGAMQAARGCGATGFATAGFVTDVLGASGRRRRCLASRTCPSSLTLACLPSTLRAGLLGSPARSSCTRWHSCRRPPSSS